ncbi:MAG: queuine tRNA-ribosyltransferase [Planctomycetota bacterium]|nr:MAG: queuine tRNA-ribosyltransferase [Planctomycetota bacterium]
MKPALAFRIEARDPRTAARTGRLRLLRGEVRTPAFMPVGTAGAVKGVLPAQLRGLGAEIVLGNTYHLLLRPGPDVVRAAGGLPAFMGWHGPMLTDSGGFQVFSLAQVRRITEEGVRFRSHVDGREVMLSPERSIEVQHALGADIIMAFDECPPGQAGRAEVRRAVERTLAWAERCVRVHRRAGSEQALFGIQQGGTDPALRRQCTERLLELDLPGYAVGGLAVGEERAATFETLAVAAPLLPADRPRYLMGLGKPDDLVEAIGLGIDLFDCVVPTRNARNATAYTAAGRLNLRNARFRTDWGPLEEDCDCHACQSVSRAYLRHLLLVGEPLAGTLISIHNLRFYMRLCAAARAAIAQGCYAEWAGRFLERFRGGQS